MTFDSIAVVAAGALLGGFVSGLAGFGTGLVALGIWLHVISPRAAAPLVAMCSVLSQALTLHAVWRAIDFAQVWPMVLAGVIGVPLGAVLLAHVDPGLFRFATGLFLIVWSAAMLATRGRLVFRPVGRWADAAVGFCGGVLGGIAGLSGPLPTAWASVQGWSKDRRRGVFQIFNLVVLAAALCAHAVQGLVTPEVAWSMLYAVPGTVIGSWLGAHVYRRLSDTAFSQLVLGLLAVSGLTLIWPTLSAR